MDELNQTAIAPEELNPEEVEAEAEGVEEEELENV